jgi:hypothetical protein
MELDIEELLKRFDHAPVDAAQAERLERLREAYKALAAELNDNAPIGRALSLAITNLEQSAMWASKAVTHG